MMHRFLALLSLTLFLASPISLAESDDSPASAEPSVADAVESAVDAVAAIDPEKTLSAYVIPIEGAIGRPTLFAIRSGIKDAIEKGAALVVFDMDTPGGELGSTLEILETIDRFEGDTATFISGDAISAGAIIASVTQDIYFSPRATMGSAEVVTGTGEDVDESMKRKINAYLTSKLDAYIGEYRYRSDVLQAMIEPKNELIIDEVTLSKEGDLLNLNARRAHEEYGDPPQPLLGAGIYDDLDGLLESVADGREIARTEFVSTWSLDLAAYLMDLAPVLVGLGILALLVEFKTPGFGVFGVAGIALIAIVNFGHHVAGLSGYEGLIFFILGAILVFVEFVFLPGVLFLALPGLMMMLGGLLWSMADIWPAETPEFDITFDLFLTPLVNVGLGIVIAMVLFIALLRFLPKSMVWNRLVLAEAVDGTSLSEEATSADRPGAGAAGVALTDLFPTGDIEVDGESYEARAEVGSIVKGSRIRILRAETFSYVVEEAEG